MALLDVIFPGGCVGCGRPRTQCCPECRERLDRPARLVWPQPSPPGLPPPWSALIYDELARSMLIAFKERGAVGLARVLAAPLATAIIAAAGEAPGGVVLVPVPSTRHSIRQRGDDVVGILCRRAAVLVRRSGVRVQARPVLRHVRAVADSAGLGAQDRAVNLAGAFGLAPGRRLDGDSVLVVDDLITTGTTIAEAARVLTAGGATVLGAATFAATQRRRGAQ